MTHPIDINEVRNFVAWQFFTKLPAMKDEDEKWDLVRLFTDSISDHVAKIELDGDDAMVHVRSLLCNADNHTAHALYHLSTAMTKWEPTERDLCFLCGAVSRAEAA